MASILSVEQLRGLSSGDTPNTITLPTGQTLDFSAGTLTMPAGHVIQVVTGSQVNQNDLITSTSFTATSLSVNITPSSTSNKIFVSVSAVLDVNNNGNSAYYTLYRDSTNLADDVGDTNGFGRIYSGSSRPIMPLSLEYLDSPNSTSQLTYNFRVRSTTGDRVEVPGSFSRLTITAMEISG
jgi:hypothetical protein